jgi:hypothetical protein
MPGGMTKSERDELARLVRRREKLAKGDVDRRAAELIADFEAQLATIYDAKDARWREAYEEAVSAVEALNARIAEQCERHDIPARFAPRAGLGFGGRGENALPARRYELRQVARTRIAADAKAAKVEIERASVEIQTQLVAGGLESEEAKAFLASMPTAEALMRPLALPEIERGKGS